MTEEICLAAVYQNEDALEYVSENLRDAIEAALEEDEENEEDEDDEELEQVISNYKQGVELRKNGKWEQSIDIFNKAIGIPIEATMDDDDKQEINLTAGLLHQRSYAYKGLGQFDKALEDLNKALELAPNSAMIWESRAYVYKGLKQFDKALEDLNKALKFALENPKENIAASRCAVILNGRAYVYKGLGQLGKAIEDLNKALELAPNFATVWDSRAEMYEAQGEYAKAAADCRKALEFDPNMKEPKETLARCEAILNKVAPTGGGSSTQQTGSACPKCGKIIQQGKKFCSACGTKLELTCGSCGAKLEISEAFCGECGAALTPAKTASEIAAEATASYKEGEKIWKEGKYKDSMELFTKAINLGYTETRLAYYYRGEAYRLTAQYDLALSDYNAAINLDKNFASAYGARGETYRLKAQYDQAISDFNTAISLNANNDFAYACRGMTYMKKGLKQDAIRDLEKALSINANFQWAKDRLQEAKQLPD